MGSIYDGAAFRRGDAPTRGRHSIAARAVPRPVEAAEYAGRPVEALERRRLRLGDRWVVSFVSASYLGFEQDPRVKQAACGAVREWGVSLAMPRVLASDRITVNLELAIARFAAQEEAIIFPSTTHVALDVLPSLTCPPAAIFVDAGAYPTLLEGVFAARRRGARAYTFAHNDPDALQEALRGIEDNARKIIVCNGIYPEGGHAAPLRQFARIARSADALLYVDDSHGIGILGEGPPTPDTPYGTGGGGLLRWLGVRSDRVLLTGTLGKALGVPVAFVAGSRRVIDEVRSASKAFVHSSTPSIPNVAAALEALRLQELEGDQRRSRVAGLVRRFQYALRSRGVRVTSRGLFPIQTISYGSAREAQQAGRFLQQRGIWPVVQLETLIRPDSGVLRFVITALHMPSEIDRTIDVLAVFDRRNGRRALSLWEANS